MVFRTAGSLASLLFPSSSSAASSDTSKRPTSGRRSSPAAHTQSDARQAAGELGDDLSAASGAPPLAPKREGASQQSQATVTHARPGDASPGPSFRTFGTRRRSSDRSSSRLSDASSRAGGGRSSVVNGSARSSPLRKGKLPPPSSTSSSTAEIPSTSRSFSARSALHLRSPSSLGELDLGPALTCDALAQVFAASPTARTTPASSSYRPPESERMSPSSSSDSNAAPPPPPPPPPPALPSSTSFPSLQPPPPVLTTRHSRSDSLPLAVPVRRPSSPTRVVYSASASTPSAERLALTPPSKPELPRDALAPENEGLDGQALDGVTHWQQDVWVTLRSEASTDEFYANPRTGDCSWEPPTGALVLPIPSEGQWWELADLSNDGTVYYHQTATKVTSWTRPTSGLIIPLSMIQLRNLGFFQPQPAAQDAGGARETRRRTLSAAAAPAAHQQQRIARPALNDRKHSAPAVSFAPHPAAGGSSPNSRARRSSPSSKPRAAAHMHRSLQGAAEKLIDHPLPPLHPQAQAQPPTAAVPPQTPPRRGSAASSTPREGRSPAPPASPVERPKLGKLATQFTSRWGSKGSLDTVASPVSLPSASSTVPPMPPMPLPSKRLSTGEHFVLPSDLNSAIQRFAVPDFSEKYLSHKHSEGNFRRRKIPMERVMRWQKAGINEPLLVLDPPLKPHALKAFRIIQRAMGDRSRPVDVPSAGGGGGGGGGNRTSFMMLKTSKTSGLTERERVLTEVRWLLALGITHPALRDEIWSQVLKQLSSNPSLASVVRGYELLCLLSATFAPSAPFEAYVRGFIRSEAASAIENEEVASKVKVMTEYCRVKLRTNKPARGKPPTILEIETAMGAAFYPSTFGSTLEETMAKQALLYPSERVPIVLPFLAQGIIDLGGLVTEGLFRVPGDSDEVTMLKDRINRGRYDLEGVDDVHTLGSLFKLWLRELQEPLVPANQYNTALTVSADADAVCGFVRSLPELQRNVFLFLVSFLQMLTEHAAATKMSLQNLALVFAPSIFRCPDLDANDQDAQLAVPLQLVNAAYERAFMVHLLQALDPRALGYAPFQDVSTTTGPVSSPIALPAPSTPSKTALSPLMDAST